MITKINFKPPYYAVIFTSKKRSDVAGYESMANRMLALAQQQDGYLGVDSVREENGMGITVSYWKTLESISSWKKNTEHLEAQRLGRKDWYEDFQVRICKVEREYSL